MIITTRTDETRYNPQAQKQVPVEHRVYVCDFNDADGVPCSTVQEEGHAPEDVQRLPRGWRVLHRAGQEANTQLPIICPKHTLDEIAGRALEARREIDIVPVSAVEPPGIEALIGRRR